ncbi:MAG: hypothetical protein A2V52_04700 [Actinobacteria bacterium RBG_19FT_COMBO_54_7]|uniref:Uncharacterized protein n=1 Tax=Candidatus Solincola sediminis TaxID=1797199 RepID=A0A1F2WJ08_9ACTN|nr:MAG: hypothetical protein A2Y75_06640 [Candidatus Solincola sediminis]OFW61060.1 MAG: hypothetical protein A2W01_07355 [Candidatus Solincola sediminis]OFW70197.1 MAG: hypothetical protein A2V52_04700 [Actinobacteria bacterium RBG_19FT_COMBO_54_7]
MSLKDRFDECCRRIKFTDLDLASRSVAMLWLDTFQQRVILNCFPHAGSKSLLDEVSQLINSIFLEGYILARAAEDRCDGNVVYSNSERPGSVESAIDKLRLMYENEGIGEKPFHDQPPAVESLAQNRVREIVYGPQLIWMEERELLKVHLIYAVWAGYRLAQFEKRLSWKTF